MQLDPLRGDTMTGRTAAQPNPAAALFDPPYETKSGAAATISYRWDTE